MHFLTDKYLIHNYLINQVRSLLVDFDDTLVDYKTCENLALNDLFSWYQLDIEQYPGIGKLYTDINNKLWPLLEKGKMSIPEIRKRRFEIMSEKVPFNDDPLVIDSKYLKFFVKNTTISNSTISVIKSLKNAGYKIMITTNGIREVQRKRINKVGLESIVDGVITSEDVEHAKPSPVMFETALRRLSSKNEEAFVVGDSLTSDIAGANNANIPSCWITEKFDSIDFRGLPKPDTVSPNFETFSNFILE
ncbi:MAG: putative HAD-hydrolase YfnB [Candidatus Heimdallarchaeota archaeon LC_2]|nr:MAG: putative HAD-hydrolase YfnB [Candidatus Heimdallarchaeota archaeon LC_2]